MKRGEIWFAATPGGDRPVLVLTPFAMGLALLLLVMIALLESHTRVPGLGLWRRHALLALTLSAALFLHTVVGQCAVLVVGAWWCWSALAALRGDATARGRLLPLAGTIAAALVLLSPYLLAIMAGKRAGLGLGLSAVALRSAVLGGAAILPAAAGWCLRRAGTSEAARLMTVAAIVLLSLGLFVQLPEHNQSKFFNLAWLLLAPPAALGWSEWTSAWGRAPRWAMGTLGAIALLPTVALSLWAFAGEHGQSASTVQRSGAAEREALDWLDAHTSTDVALCDLAGARDLLTDSGRSVLWGGRSGERDWGYPAAALAARRQAVTDLCLGRDPSGEGLVLLRSLSRDVVVVSRTSVPDSLRGGERLAARPERFRPLFRNEAMSFYRWEPAR